MADFYADIHKKLKLILNDFYSHFTKKKKKKKKKNLNYSFEQYL